MTNAQGYAYVEAKAPISYAKVANPKGFLDLFVHKNNNGKALRIANKDGQMVCVGIDKVDDLIAKLKEVKAKGAKTSTNVLPI